ncbi:unnamed protein product [Meloidogyne enterolobii]|uniref:Uncharacterized protein n=1 Tax=Meloidogyne enterolobii TaxID=390850 RepID=A0ACB1ATC0_MELEN
MIACHIGLGARPGSIDPTGHRILARKRLNGLFTTIQLICTIEYYIRRSKTCKCSHLSNLLLHTYFSEANMNSPEYSEESLPKKKAKNDYFDNLQPISSNPHNFNQINLTENLLTKPGFY